MVGFDGGAAQGAGTGVWRTGGWLVPLTVLIVGSFMSVLDTSIVNVAIPSMQHELGTSTDDVRWVVTGYTLALGVVVPLSGWLGDRLGLTRVYVGALLGFAAASALCGMAWDFSSMIVFRILQAVPGGMLPVVSMTLLYRIVPRERIGTAMGLYGLGVVFAPALGPTLGGWLVEYVDWRLIFYINVPVGLLGALAAVLVLPTIRPTSWPRFDLWGFVTIAYGLFALLLATDKGESWGWTSYPVLILLTSSALSLAAFVIIELEVHAPLLDVRVFRVWPYTNSLLLISVISVGLFTTLYYIPQFLQLTQGLQALDAGLALMPSALVMVVLTPLAGRLYDRFGPRWPAVVGLSVTAVGTFLMTGITPDTPRAEIVLWTVIRNVGVGLSMMPIMTAGVAALAGSQVGAGSALNNVALRVSSSLGLAVLGGLITGQQAQLMSDRGAAYTLGMDASPALTAAAQRGATGLYPIYQQLLRSVVTETYANVFLVTAVLCVIGVALALLLRSGPAVAAAGQGKSGASGLNREWPIGIDGQHDVRVTMDEQRRPRGRVDLESAPAELGHRPMPRGDDRGVVDHELGEDPVADDESLVGEPIRVGTHARVQPGEQRQPVEMRAEGNSRPGSVR